MLNSNISIRIIPKKLVDSGLNCRCMPTLISPLWCQMSPHIISTVVVYIITYTMTTWWVQIIALEAQIFMCSKYACLFMSLPKVKNYINTSSILVLCNMCLFMNVPSKNLLHVDMFFNCFLWWTNRKIAYVKCVFLPVICFLLDTYACDYFDLEHPPSPRLLPLHSPSFLPPLKTNNKYQLPYKTFHSLTLYATFPFPSFPSRPSNTKVTEWNPDHEES